MTPAPAMSSTTAAAMMPTTAEPVDDRPPRRDDAVAAVRVREAACPADAPPGTDGVDVPWSPVPVPVPVPVPGLSGCAGVDGCNGVHGIDSPGFASRFSTSVYTLRVVPSSAVTVMVTFPSVPSDGWTMSTRASVSAGAAWTSGQAASWAIVPV